MRSCDAADEQLLDSLLAEKVFELRVSEGGVDVFVEQGFIVHRGGTPHWHVGILAWKEWRVWVGGVVVDMNDSDLRGGIVGMLRVVGASDGEKSGKVGFQAGCGA